MHEMIKKKFERMDKEALAKIEMKEIDEILRRAHEVMTDSFRPKFGKGLRSRPGNRQERQAAANDVDLILSEIPCIDDEIRVDIVRISDFTRMGNSLTGNFFGPLRNKCERKISDAKKWLKDNPN